MKHKLLRLAAVLALLTVSLTANAAVWVGANFGGPNHGGSVITNETGSLTVNAGGNDIWGNSDTGYFYYTWVTGNFDARVNVLSDFIAQPYGTNYGGSEWAKCELMVRQSDSAVGVQGNDAFIASMCAPGQNNGNQHQYRGARSAGAANDITPNASLAVTLGANWLRLTRTNSVITMYASPDNATWTTLATIDTANSSSHGFTAWPDLISIGVAVTAHDNNNWAENYCTFDFTAPEINTSGTVWGPPTSASIVQDVTSVPSTYVGSEASFSFVASNNAAPIAFPMSYQWYRNGVLAPGATGTAYTWLAQAGDAGTHVQCVSWPTPFPSVTVTSAVGTLTAVDSSSVLIGKALKVEVFAGASRDDVNNDNTTTARPRRSRRTR